MLFHSLTFLVFAGLFFALWPLAARRNSTRWGYLTVASLVFYGWWDWRYILLIVVSGLIDYLAALGMAHHPRLRRALLAVSVIGNLTVLGTFKYLAFFTENLNALLGLFPGHASLPVPNILLPIGISFYTFQSMSYTIDVYRGEMQPTPNLLHFFAYLAMFPQLVAGPIIRAKDLLPQLEQWSPPTSEERWEGTRLIVFGYFKKMVIADSLAPVVGLAFAGGHTDGSAAYWWAVAAMFTIQLYYYFSGYTDIARGLGRWMGYSFPLNFHHPYVASSLRDYWSRWHISMSTWFTRYVFFPLGGTRCSRPRIYLNLWLTFLASGLWHGAGWNFVLWGAVHATFYSVELLTNWPARLHPKRFGKPLSTSLVLVQLIIARVIFRSGSVDQALGILASMFDFSNISGSDLLALPSLAFFYLGFGVVFELFLYYGYTKLGLMKRGWYHRLEPIVLILLIAACIYLRGPGSPFIYFRF